MVMWVRGMPRYSNTFVDMIQTALDLTKQSPDKLEIGLNMSQTRVQYAIGFKKAFDKEIFENQLRRDLLARRQVRSAKLQPR